MPSSFRRGALVVEGWVSLGDDVIPSSRTLLIPLFRGLVVTTNGTALSKTTLNLDVPQVRYLLPQCEALFLIGVMEGLAQDLIDWNVGFIPGFDRDHEQASAIDIAATAFTLPSPVRCPDYNTTTNFLSECRLQLWWRNHVDISGAKTATIGAILGARTVGR